MTTALDPITADATRREFLALIATAGLLSGCADRSSIAPDGFAPGFPRSVAHAKGSTEIPGPPQRVYVDNSSSHLDCLLALGVPPIVRGAAAQQPLTPWTRAAGAGDVATTRVYDPDLEVLAQERIDLAILEPSLWDDPAIGGRVRALAPTIVFPVPFSIPAALELYGAALGREDRAVELIRDWDAELDTFSLPDRPADVSVFVATPEGPFVYNRSTTFVGAFFARLGLALIDQGRPADEAGFVLSTENLGRLDADRIIALDNYGPNTQHLDALEASPLFRQIPAVAQGRYRRLDPTGSLAVLFHSPLCLPRALDALRRAFT